MGTPEAYRQGHFREWHFDVTGDESSLRLTIAVNGNMRVEDRAFRLILPWTETRNIEIVGARLASERHIQDGRVLKYQLET